jgi:hypothetical protein
MSADATVDIDPQIIYFTFSRIRPKFSCGRTVQETIDALSNGSLSFLDLPRISVLFDGRHYYSLNNRRLYVFKVLREAGLVTMIPARLKAVPNTKRMKEKYTPSKCSLTAKLMPEHAGATGGMGGGAEGCSSGEEEEEVDDDSSRCLPNQVQHQVQNFGVRHGESQVDAAAPSLSTLCGTAPLLPCAPGKKKEKDSSASSKAKSGSSRMKKGGRSGGGCVSESLADELEALCLGLGGGGGGRGHDDGSDDEGTTTLCGKQRNGNKKKR